VATIINVVVAISTTTTRARIQHIPEGRQMHHLHLAAIVEAIIGIWNAILIKPKIHVKLVITGSIICTTMHLTRQQVTQTRKMKIL
jgi:hypothetical protein